MTTPLFPIFLAVFCLPLCAQDDADLSINKSSQTSLMEKAPKLKLLKGASVSAPVRDENGFLSHTVQSPYQAGQTEIRVLLPDQMQRAVPYPVIYVLPVEPRGETRFGDGLVAVRRQSLHNKYEVLFISPTFSDWPWYADHPTKQEIWQESHFLNIVIPFVEQAYPASKRRKDRLLLGFSKSGWGSWSLLLRHLEVFGQAAAWDAPLMMAEVGKYGNRSIFGTQKNFEEYLPANLLRMNADKLRDEKRLILTGHDLFRQQHEQVHRLMQELKIPHDYRDGPKRQHDWHSGWVCEAVQLLLAGRTDDTNGVMKRSSRNGPHLDSGP